MKAYTRHSSEPYKPLYEYSVASVSDLLLCLKPHVLREIRRNLQEREPDFNGENARQVSDLLTHIEEMLADLDGEA
jgi:hypothetical protein